MSSHLPTLYYFPHPIPNHYQTATKTIIRKHFLIIIIVIDQDRTWWEFELIFTGILFVQLS